MRVGVTFLGLSLLTKDNSLILVPYEAYGNFQHVIWYAIAEDRTDYVEVGLHSIHANNSEEIVLFEEKRKTV